MEFKTETFAADQLVQCLCNYTVCTANVRQYMQWVLSIKDTLN